MTETEVKIAFAVVSPEGPQNCQGNSPEPATVELPEPLGDRAVVDGLIIER